MAAAEGEEDKVEDGVSNQHHLNERSDNDRCNIIVLKKCALETSLDTEIRKGGIMAKRNIHSFNKFQKELERKKKAKEKIARRQGKKEQETEVDEK